MRAVTFHDAARSEVIGQGEDVVRAYVERSAEQRARAAAIGRVRALLRQLAVELDALA